MLIIIMVTTFFWRCPFRTKAIFVFHYLWNLNHIFWSHYLGSHLLPASMCLGLRHEQGGQIRVEIKSDLIFVSDFSQTDQFIIFGFQNWWKMLTFPPSCHSIDFIFTPSFSFFFFFLLIKADSESNLGLI